MFLLDVFSTKIILLYKTVMLPDLSIKEKIFLYYFLKVILTKIISFDIVSNYSHKS